MIAEDKKRVTVTLNEDVAEELEKLRKRWGLASLG